MINIFDKYFDEDGNWISFDYYYGNFITSAAEIKGYIDFSCNKEDNFDFFNTLKKYPESYEKIANLVVNKYAETKNIENVKNYFIDELDQFITTSMIEKIIEYVVNDKSTKTVHNEIMPGWTTCPECKKIDKTTYGQIDWDLYYKTRQSLYKCDRCNIAYSQSGNKLKRLKKIGKNK